MPAKGKESHVKLLNPNAVQITASGQVRDAIHLYSATRKRFFDYDLVKTQEGDASWIPQEDPEYQKLDLLTKVTDQYLDSCLHTQAMAMVIYWLNEFGQFAPSDFEECTEELG